MQLSGVSEQDKVTEIKSYRDLKVWQNAMDLAVECYQVSKKLPKTEAYGLSSQIQRAATSVPANIAEGRARQHTKEFLQFLSVAYGSLAEVETHILLAHRLNYVEVDQVNSILDKSAEIGRMINGLQKSLRQKA